MQLRGARVLITGGSSGIGLAVAHQLAAGGSEVTVLGSDPDRVAAAANRIPGDGRVCDLADAAAVAALGTTMAAGPAFDVVVHSAGIGLRAPAAGTPEAAMERMLAVNVRAPLALTAMLLPAMVARGSGRIAFVGSIAGAVGAAGEAAYAATKAALGGYADSLAVELAGTGVGVTTLLPGVVQTAFFDRRGTPYHRPRPKPVPVQRAARALVRGVARDRALVTVPGWLRIPIALHGLAPQTYGRLAGRWGR